MELFPTSSPLNYVWSLLYSWERWQLNWIPLPELFLIWSEMTLENSVLLLSAGLSRKRRKWVAVKFIEAVFYNRCVYILRWQICGCYFSSLRRGTDVLLGTFLAAFYFLSPASHTQMLPAAFTRGPGHTTAVVGERWLFFVLFFSPHWTFFFALFFFVVSISWEGIHYKPNHLEIFTILLQEEAFIHVCSASRKASNSHLAFAAFEHFA